uniref:Ig-like domain-containing protein n=1 Tax=Hucho hucho TaxID=62062 RepID=A0A4W5JNQ0_9TELE
HHTLTTCWGHCTLITALTYVSCQKAVIQTPSVLTVSTKGTATFLCDITEDEGNYVNCYKQVPGGAPQYVLSYYYTDDSPVEYGSGFSSDRFTSKATSDKDYQFIISNVEEADSAVYYCQTQNDSPYAQVFGQGTKLIVTDGEIATPAVTLFPPSTEDLKSSRATLVCLASNLSQKSKGLADVSWMSSGESVTEDVSTSPAEQQPDNTFKISSYLTIQTAEWDKDVVFTCKVSLGSTFSEKEIRKTSCSL